MIIRIAAAICIISLCSLLSACAKSPEEGVLSAEDRTVHNRVVGLMGKFEYQAAMDLLQGLSQRQPDSADLRIDLAIATLNRQQEGDEQRALTLLYEVIEAHPDNLRALYTAGILELHGGESGKARERFRRVSEADPQDAYAAYYLAQSLAEQGYPDQAIELFRRAMRIDPYLRSAYYGAFQQLRRLQRMDEAQVVLQEYRDLESNPRAHLAEYKYTRMGAKAEVKPLTAEPAVRVSLPEGDLFAGALVLDEEVTRAGSLTVADIDADGDLDMLFTAVNASQRNLVLLQEAAGYRPRDDHPLADIPAVNAVLWGDIDNDGLLDAYLCRNGKNQYWRQTSPGVWEEREIIDGAGGEALNTRTGLLLDADHDGDLDIFLVNQDGPNELLNNNLDGSFRPLAEEYGLQGVGSGAHDVIAVDLDNDRDLDLVVINQGGENEVWLNDRLWSYRRAEGFDAFRRATLSAVLAQDADVDGVPELYTLGDQGVMRWHPDPQGEWLAETLAGAGGAAAAFSLTDFDGDTRPDLLIRESDGMAVYRLQERQLQLAERFQGDYQAVLPVVLDPAGGPSLVSVGANGIELRRPGAGRHPFIALTFSGREDKAESMRSNASGIGTRMAARIGALWSTAPMIRNSSSPGQSAQPLSLGLAGADRIDFLSIDWTDGVFQSELDLAAGELHHILETQRQLSSCPVLFVWDGERYRFVSDLLGVGGVGFAVGPGEYAPPRPWENFLLPAESLQPRGGRFHLKLTEPMEEAMYLDAARLKHYDLPPGWSMVLDERMGILDPQPTGSPLFYRDEILPQRVVNDRGEEVTATVRTVDNLAAPVGHLDRRFIGRLQGEHQLVLEFSQPLQGDRPLVLIMDGWIEYPYSQTMFAAWQAKADYQAPSLDAYVDGEWRTVFEQFGYPAGMPRRSALPIGRLPAGVTKLRLRTNQEVYWDRLALAYQEQPPVIERGELSLRLAEVRSNGFARRSTAAQRLPHYDYARRTPLWDTRHMSGFYTELGDALELVQEVDDAVAIIGPGEEVHLEFAAPAEAPPAGWTRHYVLESNGWAKDKDLFTRDGETLAPLPVRGVQADPAREPLHAKYNTRFRSGF